MSENFTTLDHPPFPTMDWDACGWWTGEISLSFGNGVGLNVTPYDPDVTRIPTAAQGTALTYQIHNADLVFAAVLDRLLPYYQKLRPKYVEYLGDAAEKLMPAVTHHEALSSLIDLRQVHVHAWEKSGSAYVGLQFGCKWDVEHGLGAMMHNHQVVELGGADVSFAWAPEEADNV